MFVDELLEVLAVPQLDDVINAADSDDILDALRKHSCSVRMTSEKHRSGTERIHEVSQSVDADVYVNVQGDETMIRADHIAKLGELLKKSLEIPICNLKTTACRT